MNDNYYIANCVGITVAAISLLASLLLLLVIEKERAISKKPLTSYILLIKYMTVWQVIFDFGYLFFAGTLYSSSNDWSSRIVVIICFPSKIITIYWSSIIISMVTYMLFYKKYLNIRPYILGLNVFSVLFAIPTAVLGGIYNGTDPISVGFIDTVQTIFTVLVAYNIVLCVCNIVKLRLLKIPSTSRIKAFVFALLGYPLVQIISRLPTIVYLYTYGYHFQYASQSPSVGQTVALYMDYLTDPLAGIGFLIIFTYTQVGSFDVCMDFLYSLVGLTWRVEVPVGAPRLFHQDTLFFATSIRRVNSISAGGAGRPSGRHSFESVPSVMLPSSGANMNDDFGVASTAANAQNDEMGHNNNNVTVINSSTKPVDTSDDVELYDDLFDKFQEEPLLNQHN